MVVRLGRGGGGCGGSLRFAGIGRCVGRFGGIGGSLKVKSSTGVVGGFLGARSAEMDLCSLPRERLRSRRPCSMLASELSPPHAPIVTCGLFCFSVS